MKRSGLRNRSELGKRREERREEEEEGEGYTTSEYWLLIIIERDLESAEGEGEAPGGGTSHRCVLIHSGCHINSGINCNQSILLYYAH